MIQPYREHMKLMYNDTNIQGTNMANVKTIQPYREQMKLMYNDTNLQGTHEANVQQYNHTGNT